MFIIICAIMMVFLIQTLMHMLIKLTVQIPAFTRRIAILAVMIQPHCVMPARIYLWTVTGKSDNKLWFTYETGTMNLYGYGKSSSLINSDAMLLLWLSKICPGQSGSLSTRNVYVWFGSKSKVNGSINENQTVIVFIWDQLLLDIYFDIICCLLDMFCQYTSCDEWSDSQNVFMCLLNDKLVMVPESRDEVVISMVSQKQHTDGSSQLLLCLQSNNALMACNTCYRSTVWLQSMHLVDICWNMHSTVKGFMSWYSW